MLSDIRDSDVLEDYGDIIVMLTEMNIMIQKQKIGV